MGYARLGGKQTLQDGYNCGVFSFNLQYVNIILLALIPPLDNQGGESKMKMSGSRLFQTWLREAPQRPLKPPRRALSGPSTARDGHLFCPSPAAIPSGEREWAIKVQLC